MYAVFKNNKFISFSDSNESLDESYQLKEIPEHQSNLKLWKWVGDCDTGKMVHRYEENYPEEELKIEKELFEIINKVYQPGVQLTLIIKQLHLLASKTNLFDEEFKEMSETILTAVEKQSKRIKFYLKAK
jgi:hypothetical protein